MKPTARFREFSSLLLAAVLMTGCATNKSDAKATSQDTSKSKSAYKNRQYIANPSKVKFGVFKYVELKDTELAPQCCNHKANQQSARKIDEMLLGGLKIFFPNTRAIPPGGEFSKIGECTLQISPRIEDIRLVSVGSRVGFGVMAGGSDIVMKVIYRDSSTSEVIADPEFWSGSSAGNSNWGSEDNQIRDAVVGQIVNYTRDNKL